MDKDSKGERRLEDSSGGLNNNDNDDDDDDNRIQRRKLRYNLLIAPRTVSNTQARAQSRANHVQHI